MAGMRRGGDLRNKSRWWAVRRIAVVAAVVEDNSPVVAVERTDHSVRSHFEGIQRGHIRWKG